MTWKWIWTAAWLFVVLSIHPGASGLRERALQAGVSHERSPSHTTSTRFADELWSANEDIYRAILAHPFLRGMTDGKLDRRTFVRYLLQDAYYLHEFADALKAAAAKSPRKDWAELLMRHAQDSLAEELRLHESVFKEFGVPRSEIENVEPLPDAFAYASFVRATAHGGSFAEAMTAMLPCYWIYLEVGRELQKRGSPDPLYQKWIAAYGSASYASAVQDVIAIVNEVAERASDVERARMRALYRRGSRYEWMFWNASFDPRPWPPTPVN
jgi:thiaminase/transcriptional activator TenA